MRIATRQIYRAFPELDRFTDEQCEMLVRRIRQDTKLSAWLAVLTALMLVLPGCGIIFTATLIWLLKERWFPVSDWNMTYLALALIVVICVPTGLGLFMRDWYLRRSLMGAIDVRIERVRCLKCRYILIGQREKAGRVTCPECGAEIELRSLGITPADLIPPTSIDDHFRQP